MSTAALPLQSSQAMWTPRHNPWLVAVAVTLATFMEVLDTSIANVALPHIAGNLSAGVDESTWVLTSYLVSNAIVLPLSGFFSNLLGRKRFYMLCVMLFTISSALCGLAANLPMLVFFRVLQGVGGGGLQPSEQAILVDTFPPHKRGMGMAVYGIAVVVAPILGPTLGGWITDNYSWRWVFFINIPVGILSLILTSQLVEDPPYLKQKRSKGGFHIDYIGMGLIALGLGTLQVVLDKGQREDWFASRFIILFAGIAAVGLIAAVMWEWFNREPMVDLHLLKERNFALATFLMFVLGFVLYGSTMLLPLMLQTLMGYSATDAGMALSPGGMVTMAMMPLIGLSLTKARIQPRMLVAIGLAAVSVSMFYMAHFSLNIDFRTAMTARMIMGFGLAFLFVPINTAAYYYLPREKNNNASGLINLARNLGGSFGIALTTTLLARWTQVHYHTLSAHISPYNPVYQNAYQSTTRAIVPYAGGDPVTLAQQAQTLLAGQVQRQAHMLAFVDNYRLLGFIFLLVIPLVMLMKKGSGAAPAAAH